MSNELSLTFKDLSSMAQVMSRSGLFGKKPDEMLSLMLLAQAQGIHPALVAQDYDVIGGKPAINSRAALSRFQQSGGKIQWTERTDKKVTAVFNHPQGGELEITWTWERAVKAGLTQKQNRDGSPNMWMKYPAQMLSARVIAEGVRAVFPACLSGFYTVEELNDIPSDMPALNATPEPKKSAPVETHAEVVDNDVKDAMPDTLEIRVSKMLDYMDAAGIYEESVLEYLGKNHCTMIDESDLDNLVTLIKECTKLASAAGEPVNVVLQRNFKKPEITINNGEQK